MIKQAKLWSIVEKYDSFEYSNFCDTICNLICDRKKPGDLMVVYNHYDKLDACDRELIDSIIGKDIEFLLFSI